MTRAGLVLLAFLAAMVGLSPVSAASFEWGGTVEGRVGYGTNPFLDDRSNAGTGIVGFTVAPELRWTTPTSRTTLAGSYNRDQYFSRYRHAEDYNVELRRTQDISAKLTGSARVGYFSSISGLLSPYYNTVVILPGAVDQVAIGIRQRRVYGDAGLSWQPTARDNFHGSVLAERDTFSGFSGDYSYLGFSGGYQRTLDQRTKVGVDLTAGHTYSHDYPDNTAYQPSLTVERTLSPHWTFNGGVGIIVEQEREAGRSRTDVTPGFNAQLCATYPRLSLCVTGSRVAATSGIGGLRRQTQVGANATYRLSERTRLLAFAVYGLSSTDRPVLIDNIAFGNQRFTLARVDAQRDISRRLTAGVSGSYQERSGGGLPNVHALAITFNLTAKFGHLS